jgi:hypothetical protein
MNTKNEESNNLIIRKPSEFGQLLDLIHDEYFDPQEIKYIKSERIIEIPYRRIFHGGQSNVIKNRLLSKELEVDVLRCLLRIKHVESYEFTDKAGFGEYSFNELQFDEKSNQLIFIGCEPWELRINIAEILIENEELGYRGKARIKEGLFWESHSGKTYD